MIPRTISYPIDPGQAGQSLRWGEGLAPQDAAVPFAVDFTALCTVTNDAVASATAAVSPNGSGDATISGVVVVQNVVTATVSPGKNGTDYAITFTVTFASGAVLSRQYWLACLQLSPEGLGETITTAAAIPGVVPPLQIVNGQVEFNPLLLPTSNPGPGKLWLNGANVCAGF